MWNARSVFNLGKYLFFLLLFLQNIEYQFLTIRGAIFNFLDILKNIGSSYYPNSENDIKFLFNVILIQVDLR